MFQARVSLSSSRVHPPRCARRAAPKLTPLLTHHDKAVAECWLAHSIPSVAALLERRRAPRDCTIDRNTRTKRPPSLPTDVTFTDWAARRATYLSRQRAGISNLVQNPVVYIGLGAVREDSRHLFGSAGRRVQRGRGSDDARLPRAECV